MRRLGVMATCAILVGACEPKVNLVHFTVPEGYRGPIAVVAHPTFVTPESFRIDRGRYSLVVPETGVVCIPSDDIFANGYLPSAAYANDAEIYHWVGPASDSITIRGIGAWGIGSWHGDEYSSVHWLGIGTKLEAEAMERAFFSNEIQTMMPSGVSMPHAADFERFKRYCASEI